MRIAPLAWPSLAMVLSFAAVNGCGDDAETTPDASTGTFDAGPRSDGAPTDSSSPTDSATSDPDAGPADAGNDAPVTTNGSTWTPAAGLPSAACTPWVLTDTADPENPEVGNGKLTIRTSADGENVFYRQTDVTTPAELVIEVRVRLVSGTTSMPFRGPVFVGFHYGPEKRKNALLLTTTEAFLLAAENTKGTAATVATTDAAHTYRIVTNTATHAIQVFRDDVSILTGTAFPESFDATAVPDILWGEVSLLANGVSEWELVKHNAHAPTACP